jgi:radical SAM protein with 4Fe4S-binding SPASM domain
MEAERMKKIKLSPFVHKVKGKKNWLLADLLKGRIFQIAPEGDVEAFKEQLVEHDLAYETEGVIPFKFDVSLKNYTEKFNVRELQIRLTGVCGDDCRDCGQICACTKGGGEITDDVLSRIIDQFKFIPVEHVLITGGNPFAKWDIIEKIKNEISATKYSVLFRGHVGEEDGNRMAQTGIELISTVNVASKVDREKMATDPLLFFYNQEFNPCWGNKIAVDLDGSIKPCLWWNKSLGNIKSGQIKGMIAAGDFEKYWKLKKDEIETCDMCEYRYNCFDCRVSAFNESGGLKAKLPCCKYDPGTGAWSE